VTGKKAVRNCVVSTFFKKITQPKNELKSLYLTLNLLTTTIVAPPSNASKWQMGYNLAFKWLIVLSEQQYTGVPGGLCQT